MKSRLLFVFSLVLTGLALLAAPAMERFEA